MNLATNRKKRLNVWGWLPAINVYEAILLLAIIGVIGGVWQGHYDKKEKTVQDAANNTAMYKHYDDCVNQVTRNGQLQLTPEAIRECRENAKTFNTN